MGEITKSNLKHEGRKITLVVGTQEIKPLNIVSAVDYTAPHGGNINNLVHSIHFVRAIYTSPLNNAMLLYYKNLYGHCIECMNDSIINLFESGVNVYSTVNGIIILWGKYDFFSTIDMQDLNFHQEKNGIDFYLKRYDIKHIYEDNGKDFIVLTDRITNEDKTFKLVSEIDLTKPSSSKIFIVPTES